MVKVIANGKLKIKEGEKFGKLTVLGYDWDKHKYKCQCDCGNIVYRKSNRLKGSKFRSCGCDKLRNDITGKKFGKLTCISFVYGENKWECQCECGNIIYVSRQNLENGSKLSCGCSRGQRKVAKNISQDPDYKRISRIWWGVKNRCYNKNTANYKSYGAKGIKVCDEWQEIENFYYWSKENGYDKTKSIDRIDSKKDYCPENCRWLDFSENCSRAHRTLRIDELNNMTSEEVFDEYMAKKVEKGKIKQKTFFYRKPIYSILTNKEDHKKYLFKRQRDVCFFLGITYGMLSYRIRTKNGILTENWFYEKINKEEFENFKNVGIEVIS